MARHFEALGEQSGAWGSLAQGLEAWVYPFKLLDGGSLFVVSDQGELVDVGPQARRQVATPQMAQIEYGPSDEGLKVTWFVPRSQPGLLVLLDATGHRPWNLAFRFRPSLAPMHLSAARPLRASWDENRQELVVTEPGRQLELRIRGPEPAVHRETSGGIHEIRFRIEPQSKRRGPVRLGFGLGHPAQPDARLIMDRLLLQAGAWIKESQNYYAQLIARAPRIESPEREVNDAGLWSVVSLDQLRLHNPYLGYGLVSGYSSSGRGTRPKYCWFFEEPTLTSCAYHWLGLSGQVRESLQFLQRFQRPDGKTAHEVVQSLPFWTNYFETFPYAYKHSDGPVYYLFAYGHYYERTGDLAFIRAEWARIRRTLDWCFRVMDPTDGLMRIDPGDWGSAESSIEVWKDTQLQGMWVKALQHLERLARELREPDLAARCRQTSVQAQASLEAKLWDDTTGFYWWGLNRQGQLLKSLVPHHAVSFWLGSLPAANIVRSLERLAAADFCTDWGVRSLAMADPKYDPRNYQAGSVWPVWNAGVIVGNYRHHRGVEAFRLWRAMVQARTLGGLGPMPEVLDGRYFQRLDGGVPHQMFSELAVVNGFFDGLLGMQVDVPTRQIELSPTLPPTWDKLTVARIPGGPGRLDLNIQRRRDAYSLTCALDWPGQARLTLAPNLPAGSRIQSVRLDGRAVPFEVTEWPSATCVQVSLPHFSGRHTLRIRHTDGIDFMPVDEPLTPGVSSRRLRVIRAGLEGNSWHMVLEGLPGRQYPVDFFTRRHVNSEFNIAPVEKRAYGWRILLTAPTATATNAAGFVRWELNVPFR